jgi:hypothetical protein
MNFDLEMAIGMATSLPLQTTRTLVVLVSSSSRTPRQAKCWHDLTADGLAPEYALVCQQCESPGLRVVRHAPTGKFLILDVGWDGAALLQQHPHLQMAAGMGQVNSIRLGRTHRGAVEKQFAAD